MQVGYEAAELRDMLDHPIYNKTLRKDVGAGGLDYEVYLRTQELLALQTPADRLVVPEELLFQVAHQTQELWLKCIAFETVNVVEALDNDDTFAALGVLDRIVLICGNLGEQMRVLSTLSPSAFHLIRRSLGKGSGLESPGYNRVLAGAEAARLALERFFGRRGATALEIYRAPGTHPDLHRVGEKFLDWDSAFQSWLVEHFMLVRRTLGIDKTVRALDGFPTVALGARMTRPLFAELWNVRVEMSRAWTSEGGYAPGASRERCPFSESMTSGAPHEPRPVAIDREPASALHGE
jgi:tryptophan 2,3-dioxygenase